MRRTRAEQFSRAPMGLPLTCLVRADLSECGTLGRFYMLFGMIGRFLLAAENRALELFKVV